MPLTFIWRKVTIYNFNSTNKEELRAVSFIVPDAGKSTGYNAHKQKRAAKGSPYILSQT
jgi:hypothetical protein